MTRPLLTALLYATLALAANPAIAGTLTEDLEALREGDMRKLIVHQAPRPVADVAFLDADGQPVQVSDSNGKVRVLNFWATWCAPCRAEKPTLDALNRTMGGADFEVIAVATGRNSDAALKRFNDQFGIETLATYTDRTSELARAVGVLGLPVTLILDRQGREVGRISGGADWSADAVRAILDRIAQDPAS